MNGKGRCYKERGDNEPKCVIPDQPCSKRTQPNYHGSNQRQPAWEKAIDDKSPISKERGRPRISDACAVNHHIQIHVTARDPRESVVPGLDSTRFFILFVSVTNEPSDFRLVFLVVEIALERLRGFHGFGTCRGLGKPEHANFYIG